MLALSLLPFLAAPALAQDTMSNYTAELASTLMGLGLTILPNVLGHINVTAQGQGILSLLATRGKNYTLFAPNDAAWKGVFPDTTAVNYSDPGLLGTLTYHVVSGEFGNEVATFPNTTIGRTYLSAPDCVMLEGNKSQVLAWSHYSSDNATHILNQNTNVSVVNSARWNNLQINVVDAVLDVPGNLSKALAANNLTKLEGVLKALPYDGSSTLFDYLNGVAHGFTLFAPTDDAFTAALSNKTLAGLLANQTVLASVLGNHVINGTTVYSGLLTQGARTSAAGSSVSAMVNGTTPFVMSGTATAHIVTPDILLQNGVVHIIGNVLLNTQTDAAAASSAYVSATSAAGTAPATTETAPIGMTSAGSATGTSSSVSASSTGKSSGATTVGISPLCGALSALGVVFGTLVTLA